MRECVKCGVMTNDFGPNSKGKDGLDNRCRSCNSNRLRQYSKTKEGLMTNIYSTQRRSSRDRGHPMPNYTLKELREWVFSQDNFIRLYDNWVDSSYSKKLTPSIDRLDDYKGYSLDNIQLITWEENKYKNYKDVKNGINNKRSKAVIGTHKITGEIIEFYSMMEAERQTGILTQSICSCCNGRIKSAGGYIWSKQVVEI